MNGIFKSMMLYVALLGVAGVLCRYGVDKVFESFQLAFPVSTFVINIFGCGVAGIVYALGERAASGLSSFHTALLVGFCGGFTTFSAYALQTFLMLEKNKSLPALLYWALSPVLGLGCTYIAVMIVRKM